ncbi:MAG: hypothetical protein K9W43_12650 [Candidatus Thorarchaeota archaeon]|nr:hypothetical protein [Candidatus Thorarchaeota archaeon]
MRDSSDMERLICLVGTHGVIEGRTRFQKIVYLLKNQDIPFSFEYIPYYYGPYSYELAEYIELLVSYGILKETKFHLADGIDRYDYQLTKKGEEIFKKIITDSRSSEFTEIKQFINKNKETNTGELVSSAKKIMATQLKQCNRENYPP